ncbi:MAG: threonine-phosphate decarboxylase [Desulfobacterales bacterium]|uniref:threonine-phosphate decarboxylase n=1 Tax=Candidatus Desulfaltia bathyphila TaxID=2841697 RepID=A0A8J6N620_9BACT|nr:threonine-phosphate decarboxylase [Candidatus Desulfaltia bathyphila]MBL7195262.1 threonine-phosphate decarboxylase [Desulfobacterales bacterium]MBL7207301.1 threonine-phosphate decarboxylase [Desulfobacterales bacterium]
MDDIIIKRDHGGNVSEISRIYGIDEDRIIDFSAGINPLGYPPGLRNAIIKDFDSVLNYPDIDSFDLVSGLSEYHGIDRDCILMGNGSTEFMYRIPMVFKPEKALIVTPAFSEYEKGLRLAGTKVSYFQTDEKEDFFIDIAGLCKRLEEGFDIVYFCNPANPTGVLTSKDELCRVIACADKTGALVVIDEAFIDFVEEESVKKEILRFSNLIVLRSMTKFFGIPGLRLGYILAVPSCIAKIRENKPPWTVNSLVQGAAVKALFDKDYIRETRQYISAEKEFLKNALNKIHGLRAFESAANYLLVFMESRIGLNSTELRNRLMPEGILIRDCSTFHGMEDRYFRVAVKKHEQNMILVEKLKKMVKQGRFYTICKFN